MSGHERCTIHGGDHWTVYQMAGHEGEMISYCEACQEKIIAERMEAALAPLRERGITKLVVAPPNRELPAPVADAIALGRKAAADAKAAPQDPRTHPWFKRGDS